MHANDPASDRPEFRVLSDKKIEQLHCATLTILEKTGVTFDCEEAIRLLGDAGADVSDPARVRIPADMVDKALKSAPKSITLCSREGEPAMVLDGKAGSHFGATPDPPKMQDPYTGEIRYVYVEDIAEVTRLIDALPNIDFIYTGAGNKTLPVATRDISDKVSLLEVVRNSSKPVIGETNDVTGLREMIDLCSMIAGGEEQLRQKPFFGTSSEPVSPLVQGREALEKSLLCAEKGLPLVVYSMPMAGTTTPATFAGCVAVANAEVLAQVIVVQLKNPGTPVIPGAITSMMDMKTTTFLYSAPETNLMIAALTEIYHHYGLPVWGTAGCTEAGVLGVQAGVESTCGLLTTMLSGADLVHDVGVFCHGTFKPPEFIVLQDEIIGMLRVLERGIEVNDETLALDVIDRLGPGANYLGEEHTMKHFRKFWLPRFFDRSFSRDDSVKECEQLLKEKAIELLETHQPKPLGENLVRKLDKIERQWLDDAGMKEYPRREART